MKKSKKSRITGLGLLLLTVCSSTSIAHAQDIKPSDDLKIGQATMGMSNPKSSATYDSSTGEIKGGLSSIFTPSGILGMDVSSWQPNVDWNNEYLKGARFAYAKATEGTGYVNPYGSVQRSGAKTSGMYAGAYHFALPSTSTGAEQARFFVNNGGMWKNDGSTLPGILDIEYNPYSQFGNTCYNMSQSELKAWVTDFTNTYKSLTGRYPMLYTTTDWANRCLGDISSLNKMPLHIANYSTSAGIMPNGWSTYDVWQYSDNGLFAGDSNVFRGSASDLKNFAINSSYIPQGAPQTQSTNAFTSAPVLRGGIGSYYYAHGGENTFGKPLANEFATGFYGGYAQNFPRHTIYWSPNTGAHSVYTKGDIGARFRENNYERGWGYPTMDESSWSDGRVKGAKQWFVNPSNGFNTAVYWSPATGTHTLNGRGAIFHKWATDVRSMGFPVTNERGISAFGGGAKQYFRNADGDETGIYWSATTGAHRMNSKGALYFAYWVDGGTDKLGYPTHDERKESDGKVHLRFSSGAHYTWTASEGVKRIS